MIRRERDNTDLLISQVEHARLAHALAQAWGNEQTAKLPLAEWLLGAVRGHDDGWLQWERAPTEDEAGRVPSFTEMPAAESVAIWSRSVEASARGPASASEALRRLGDPAVGGRPGRQEAEILGRLLQQGALFCRQEFLIELGQHPEMTEEAAHGALDRFEERGLIRHVGPVLGLDYYVSALPPVGEAPLPGLWVSEHFQALARGALDSRQDPAEQEVLREFLARQTEQGRQWREAVAGFAGEELERVIDTGLRYLQHFDRISLWFCMAERTERWEARLGQGREFAFIPETTRIIRVHPWPFDAGALELSVTAFDGEESVNLPWRLTPAE